MTDEAWDAFVDKATESRDGYETRGYTRVNSDMEINWESGGRITHAAYHNREGGLARLEYSLPVDDEAPPDYAVILARSLIAADEIAP